MKSQTASVCLADIADINPPLPQKPAANDTVSFLGMAALDAESGTTQRGEDRPYHEVMKGYTPFLANDVLVAKITPCFENCKIAQAVIDHSIGFGSTEFHVVRPKPGKADARFLLHFLRQPAVLLAGERRMTGSAGQKRVPENYFANLSLPNLDVGEQRRIADILDRADALRAKRRAAIAHLDELTQAIFIDMFGDPVSNPKGWPQAPIGDLGEVITGNTPSRANAEYYGSDIEWIKSDNVNTPYYYITKADERLSFMGKAVARTAPSGSILITCIAGSPSCIGNAAMTDREVAFNQQINAFVPGNGNPHFFYALFIVGKKLIQLASTGGMKGMVSKSRLEGVVMINPPTPVQNDFASRVLAVENMKSKQEEARRSLDALFASLQDRAFRGVL